MTAPQNKQTHKEMVRLTKDVYDDLEKQALPLVVTTSTTALQTAYIAGQQSILKLLRVGYVVGG